MTRADDQHITDATQAVAYFVVYFWCILIRMRILRIEVENVCILAYSAALISTLFRLWMDCEPRSTAPRARGMSTLFRLAPTLLK